MILSWKKISLEDDTQALEHFFELKDEMNSRGLNIAGLSKALHRSGGTVRQWVAGIYRATPANYNALAQFFGWLSFRYPKGVTHD